MLGLGSLTGASVPTDEKDAKGPNMKRILIAIAIMLGFWYVLPFAFEQIGGEAATLAAREASTVTMFSSIPLFGGILNSFASVPKRGISMITNMFSSPATSGLIATSIASTAATSATIGAVMGEVTGAARLPKGYVPVEGEPIPPHEDVPEEEDTDVSFGLGILKKSMKSLFVYLPPLWFICGRPTKSSYVNMFFASSVGSGIDQTMASFHPLWKIPKFHENMGPNTSQCKARRRSGKIQQAIAIKLSPGKGYWMVNFVDPSAELDPTLSGMLLGMQTKDLPKDYEWVRNDDNTIFKVDTADADIPALEGEAAPATEVAGPQSDQPVDGEAQKSEPTPQKGETGEKKDETTPEGQTEDAPDAATEGDAEAKTEETEKSSDLIEPVMPDDTDDDNRMMIGGLLLVVGAAAFFLFFMKKEPEKVESEPEGEDLV